MQIIDFHIHPYRRVEDNFNFYKEAGALSWNEALEDFKASGITHVCGSVITTEKFEDFSTIKRLNDEAMTMWDENRGFYTPGFHIHPGYINESLEEIEKMHQKGVKLIGEIVPYMQGWSDGGYTYGSKELKEILDLAGEYDMIFSYHTMNEWQEEMEKMVKENPKVTFVAAHPGQKGDCVHHVERMKKYENLYLDLSGTGLFRYGILPYLSKEVGSERVLFGTDYPISNPRMYVEAVKGERISDEEKELIFHKNAERLFGDML